MSSRNDPPRPDTLTPATCECGEMSLSGWCYIIWDGVTLYGTADLKPGYFLPLITVLKQRTVLAGAEEEVREM